VSRFSAIDLAAPRLLRRGDSSKNVARKCHLGSIGFAISEFAQWNVQELRNRLRILTSQSKCSYSRAEVFETIGVLSDCDPGFERGWEAGSLYRSFQRPQQRRAFLHNALNVSELAFLGSAVGSRLFSSVSDSASAMTLEMTLAPERLASSPRRKPALGNPITAVR
jgi:hypothetical protein